MQKYRRSQAGQVLLFFAVLVPLLLGCVGLAVDVGNVYVQQARFQNAVDAAALAAGYKLPNQATATAAAADYIEKNLSAQYAAAMPAPQYTEGNSKVTVSLSVPVQTYFIRLFADRFNTITVNVAAIVKATGGEVFNFSMFAGGTTDVSTIMTSGIIDRRGSTPVGTGLNIKGDIFSNDAFNFMGTGINVEGKATTVATSSVVNQSQNNVNVKNGAASYNKPLPDFAESVTGKANIPVVSTGSGSDTGSLAASEISFNGTSLSNIHGKVVVADKGDIMVSGSGTSHSMAAGTQVFVYARQGDIHIKLSDITVNAVFYAPQGKVFLGGQNMTLNGCLVAGKFLQISLEPAGADNSKINWNNPSITSMNVRSVTLVNQ